jgi:hypothetical protein
MQLWNRLKRMTPLRWGILGAAAAAFMLGGAVYQDRSPFGPITAAWMQAIFSVIAILAAIWIDRGTVRRAELARRAAQQEAVNDRISTMEACAEALRDCLRTNLEAKRTPVVHPQQKGGYEARAARQVLERSFHDQVRAVKRVAQENRILIDRGEVIPPVLRRQLIAASEMDRAIIGLEGLERLMEPFGDHRLYWPQIQDALDVITDELKMQAPQLPQS